MLDTTLVIKNKDVIAGEVLLHEEPYFSAPHTQYIRGIPITAQFSLVFSILKYNIDLSLFKYKIGNTIFKPTTNILNICELFYGELENKISMETIIETMEIIYATCIISKSAVVFMKNGNGGYYTVPIEWAIYKTASRIKICPSTSEPNAVRIYHSGYFILAALKPIKKGEKICYHYDDRFKMYRDNI